MIMTGVDGSSLPEVADVVIIGAGPSGAVTAKRLVEAGLSVVTLEQGDFPDYVQADQNGPEFDLAKTRDFAWNPNDRSNENDYPVEDSESDVAALMWNGVGGSSVLYAAAWHRFKPSDFRVQTLDGVADDWPMTYDDLIPYYERVEVDFAVSGMPGDPASPDGWEPPLPPFEVSESIRRVAEAHNRLGWHWWPGSNAIATVKTPTLSPCVRRGRCLWGCFDDAKASVDRTHWRWIRSNGGHLVTRARALRIDTDNSGNATGVSYIHRRSGETRFQAARHVVICANGIGTPRLLLLSESQRHPNGLGNTSGLVGKRLMMHPYSAVVGLFPDFFETWQGPYGQRAYSMQYIDTQPGLDFVRGAKWQLMGTGGPLNTVGSFPWGGAGEWGADFHSAVKSRFGRSLYWGIMAEDLPDESNVVTLHPTLTDSDGVPAPKVNYRVSENTRRLLAFHEKQAEQSFREAGAIDTLVAPIIRDTGWHLLGTTMMGTDPARSVVDAYGRLHDARNVIISDGSIMPTSGAVNPTGTIAALALRNAEHLIDNFSETAHTGATR